MGLTASWSMVPRTVTGTHCDTTPWVRLILVGGVNVRLQAEPVDPPSDCRLRDAPRWAALGDIPRALSNTVDLTVFACVKLRELGWACVLCTPPSF